MPDQHAPPSHPPPSRQSALRFSVTEWPTSTRGSIADAPPKFMRTLREVMFDDYMPEIHALKSRVYKLEEGMPKFQYPLEVKKSPTPVFNLLPSDDDEKLTDLLKHFNDHYNDVNQRLANMEHTLHSFIYSNGVGTNNLTHLPSHHS